MRCCLRLLLLDPLTETARSLTSYYNKTTLANGLRIVTITMPHTYSVGVGFYMSIGSRYEQPETAGAAHFIEHMLFKGTARRPSPEAIAQEIEGHGGLFNASTSQEMTVLWAKMQYSHLTLALDVLSDMLRHSLLLEAEVEKERRVILEELISSQDIPEELVMLALHDLTWPNHPLGWDVAGTPASVQGLSRAALLDYLQHSYGPANTVISVAGNVQHQQVVDQVDSLLGDWQGAAQPAFVAAPPFPARGRLALVKKKTEQSHLALYFPGLAREHEDRFALGLLNVILGEGMSSRLFLEIRERLGLAYVVDSSVSYLADAGVSGIYAAVAPGNAVQALRAIVQQTERLRREPVDAATLRNAKEFIKGRLLLSLEDTLTVAGRLGRQELAGSDMLSVEDLLARMDQVQAEDMLRVAQALWQPERACLAVVGPHKKAEASVFKAVLKGE